MKLTRLLEALALGLICLLVAMPATAAPKENTADRCSDGRDNDRDGLIDGADPDCLPFGDPPDPPGGGEVPLPDTEAGWRGAMRDVDGSGNDTTRSCFVETSTPDGSDIHYTCFHGNGSPEVAINFQEIEWVQTRKRGDATLCDFFDSTVEFTPTALTNYGFTLVEPCPALAASCEVQVLNYAFESAAAVARGVGLIIIEGIGNAAGAADNLNPFSETQLIDIFEINATFKQLGGNKTLAICQYSPISFEVKFGTSPAP